MFLIILYIKKRYMSSRLFEKYVFNNKKEAPGRLFVGPLTLFSSNPDGSINEGERNYLKTRAQVWVCIS